MYLLRFGKKNRWFNDSWELIRDVDRASADLEPRLGEEGVSLFEARNDDERQRLALLYALVCRPGLENLDCIAFPRDCFGAIRVENDSGYATCGHSYLDERHRLVRAFCREEARVSLAKAAIDHGGLCAFRITRAEIQEAAIEELAKDSEVLAAITRKAASQSLPQAEKWGRLLTAIRQPPS